MSIRADTPRSSKGQASSRRGITPPGQGGSRPATLNRKRSVGAHRDSLVLTQPQASPMSPACPSTASSIGTTEEARRLWKDLEDQLGQRFVAPGMVGGEGSSSTDGGEVVFAPDRSRRRSRSTTLSGAPAPAPLQGALLPPLPAQPGAPASAGVRASFDADFSFHMASNIRRSVEYRQSQPGSELLDRRAPPIKPASLKRVDSQVRHVRAALRGQQADQDHLGASRAATPRFGEVDSDGSETEEAPGRLLHVSPARPSADDLHLSRDVLATPLSAMGKLLATPPLVASFPAQTLAPGQEDRWSRDSGDSLSTDPTPPTPSRDHSMTDGAYVPALDLLDVLGSELDEGPESPMDSMFPRGAMTQCAGPTRPLSLAREKKPPPPPLDFSREPDGPGRTPAGSPTRSSRIPTPTRAAPGPRRGVPATSASPSQGTFARPPGQSPSSTPPAAFARERTESLSRPPRISSLNSSIIAPHTPHRLPIAPSRTRPLSESSRIEKIIQERYPSDPAQSPRSQQFDQEAQRRSISSPLAHLRKASEFEAEPRRAPKPPSQPLQAGPGPRIGLIPAALYPPDQLPWIRGQGPPAETPRLPQQGPPRASGAGQAKGLAGRRVVAASKSLGNLRSAAARELEPPVPPLPRGVPASRLASDSFERPPRSAPRPPQWPPAAAQAAYPPGGRQRRPPSPPPAPALHALQPPSRAAKLRKHYGIEGEAVHRRVEVPSSRSYMNLRARLGRTPEPRPAPPLKSCFD